jgi:hypothetical protein
MNAASRQYERLTADGQVLGQSMVILETLLRLRQITCHSRLVPEALLQSLVAAANAIAEGACTWFPDV